MARLTVAATIGTYMPSGMGGTERYVQQVYQAIAQRGDTTLIGIGRQDGVGLVPGHMRALLRGSSSVTAWGRVRALTLASRGDAEVRHRMMSADAVHYPFSIGLPSAPTGVPVVQTLYDVQHRDLPENFSRPERVWRSATYDRLAQRADMIVTISEFSRSRICSIYGRDPASVTVAYPGVDPAEPAGASGRGPFVLYPARLWPHKNHARLLQAMVLVRRQVDLKLVLTGAEPLGSQPSWLDQRGHVSRAELNDLYRSASCLVFPSLYEGFGQPVVEAMSFGCPVAASRTSALPEVCGEAAVFFDPLDPSAIAEGILAALEGAPALSELGPGRARRFTWESAAAAHVEAFRAASART